MAPIYRNDEEPTRQLPRLGIIRLGTKEISKSGREYPKAAEHFVLEDAPELKEVYGEEPTVLDGIFLAVEDENIVAPHYYTMYSARGLLCKGDGRNASRLVDTEIITATGEPTPAKADSEHTMYANVMCPCPYLESGECKEQFRLLMMIPKAPGLGVWQISTGSRNSIRNIQGTLAMLRAVAGRITGIELKLELKMEQVQSIQQNRMVTVPILSLGLANAMSPLALAGFANTLGEQPLALLPEEELGSTEWAPVEQWTAKAELLEAAAEEKEEESTPSWEQPVEPEPPAAPEPPQTPEDVLDFLDQEALAQGRDRLRKVYAECELPQPYNRHIAQILQAQNLKAYLEKNTIEDAVKAIRDEAERQKQGAMEL